MGIGRFLAKALMPGYHKFNMMKNIAEKGVKDGLKATVKEDFCEDIPLTALVFKQGQYEGKKEGYVQASYEYEAKLLDQAESFLRQKEILLSQKQEYEELISEYEKCIDAMEAKENLSQEENERLNKLIHAERKLKKMGLPKK